MNWNDLLQGDPAMTASGQQVRVTNTPRGFDPGLILGIEGGDILELTDAEVRMLAAAMLALVEGRKR